MTNQSFVPVLRRVELVPRVVADGDGEGCDMQEDYLMSSFVV